MAHKKKARKTRKHRKAAPKRRSTCGCPGTQKVSRVGPFGVRCRGKADGRFKKTPAVCNK